MKKATWLQDPEVRSRWNPCRDLPENVAYLAVAFSGRRLDPLSRGIGLARFGFGLTHLWSTSSGRFVQVAADEKGKKNGLVWAISCSPATKNSSTRPQQDVNAAQVVLMLPQLFTLRSNNENQHQQLEEELPQPDKPVEQFSVDPAVGPDQTQQQQLPQQKSVSE
ncbi:hypothetical protein Taro_013399 [Colocasia esculenta]|uniref:Uncharacterized protein n=1 Tax=Colocasia esculenta TaxID=4460 RepID=A0A843UFU9_COLES|nr:hypothetical protein [Colocasia esculenta]